MAAILDDVTGPPAAMDDVHRTPIPLYHFGAVDFFLYVRGLISWFQEEKKSIQVSEGVFQQNLTFHKNFTKVINYQHIPYIGIIFTQEPLNTLKTISHSVVQ